MLKIIVAVNNKGVIGHNNKMPWHVPADLKHFKKTTLHQNVIMGRVTFDHLPVTLKNRNVFIVSKSRKGAHVINDLTSFLKQHEYSNETYYVAGGAEIYKQSLPYVNEIILSKIDNDSDGDTFFPIESLKDFTLSDKINKEDFVINYYTRKDN